MIAVGTIYVSSAGSRYEVVVIAGEWVVVVGESGRMCWHQTQLEPMRKVGAL